MAFPTCCCVCLERFSITPRISRQEWSYDFCEGSIILWFALPRNPPPPPPPGPRRGLLGRELLWEKFTRLRSESDSLTVLKTPLGESLPQVNYRRSRPPLVFLLQINTPNLHWRSCRQPPCSYSTADLLLRCIYESMIEGTYWDDPMQIKKCFKRKPAKAISRLVILMSPRSRVMCGNLNCILQFIAW